jgi:hypothetical protein
MKSHTRTWQGFITFLGSRKFFGLTVALFVAQSSWIALSARYPQAFDEQFHLGIIQLYAHHLSPFLSKQPPNSGALGAVARDPSYFYHYLMSFPYRLISYFTHDLTIQVIFLRFINIALLGSSLFVFRKVLRYTGASRAMIHTVLFFLVLTPVFPLLGSQINYDNMTILVSGLAFLWCFRFIEQLREQKKWRWDLLAELLIICLLGSIVKYALLPIFAGLAIIIAIEWWKQHKAGHRLGSPIAVLGRAKSILYAILIIISATLFSQRYVINMVDYLTPIPQCNQVLGVSQCQAYAPWARNYMLEQEHMHVTILQMASYPFIWLYHSMGELVFTISSNFNSSGTVDYHVGTQLILIEMLSWGVFIIGGLLCIRYAKMLWRIESLRIFGLAAILYIAALGGENFLDYVHTTQPVAIHGRYLLPLMPLIYVTVALAFRKALSSIRVDKISRVSIAGRKASLTAFAMFVLLFEGGGFVTYIVRSDPSWFWPQSSPIKTVNSNAKRLLKPLIIDRKK